MKTALMKAESYLEDAEHRMETDGPSERTTTILGLGIGFALLALTRAYRGDDEEGDNV